MKNDINENKALSQTIVMQSVILPNELRIGNLVGYKFGEDEIYAIRSFDEEHVSLKDNISFDYIGYDEIERIKLNHNWLIKLTGFFDDNYRFEIKGTRTTVFFDNKYLTSLDYVHEIQNLFFCLTGSELTVA